VAALSTLGPLVNFDYDCHHVREPFQAPRQITLWIERNYNKPVYYPPISRGIRFGTFVERPSISAEVIVNDYGKYLPYRKVVVGELEATDELRAFLDEIACA
jgi:hypothetical protein